MVFIDPNLLSLKILLTSEWPTRSSSRGHQVIYSARGRDFVNNNCPSLTDQVTLTCFIHCS